MAEAVVLEWEWSLVAGLMTFLGFSQALPAMSFDSSALAKAFQEIDPEVGLLLQYSTMHFRFFKFMVSYNAFELPSSTFHLVRLTEVGVC